MNSRLEQFLGVLNRNIGYRLFTLWGVDQPPEGAGKDHGQGVDQPPESTGKDHGQGVDQHPGDAGKEHGQI